MSMLHKYMAIYGRIPNTTTHIHPHIPIQTYPLWYSQSYIPTVATIPPPPYQTYQTNLGTTENIIEHQNMLWRSSITQWLWDTPTRRLLCSLLRKLSHTLFITNLFGSNNIFLYNLCQHMAFSLWDFPANITLPPIPVLTSIVTPSSHRVPPPRFPFSSHAPTSHTLILPCTHQIFFSIYSIWMLS